MVMRSDYPHGMSDGDLEQTVRMSVVAPLSTTDTTTVLARSSLVQIGQAEQQRRAVRDLQNAVADFDTASRESAARLAFATWVLVGITVALLGATITLIV